VPDGFQARPSVRKWRRCMCHPQAEDHILCNAGGRVPQRRIARNVARPDRHPLFFDLAKTAIKPYADAGKMRMHKDGTTFAPGITAVAAPGHTVGHTMVRISSAGNEPAARPPGTLLPPCVSLGWGGRGQGAVRT